MKQFLGFVRKEFLHIFRDLRTLIIIFGIPATQIVIFGFAVSTDVKNVDIAILDYSKDEITREIINKLISSNFFNLKEFIISDKQIDDVLKSGRAAEVIVFENDFARKIERRKFASVNIIVDASEPNRGRTIANYTSSIIREFGQNLNVQGGKSPVKSEVKMYYNPSLEDSFMFVPGVITLILILICALMTSVTITREKEFGTMEVLLVSPLKPLHIIVGKVIPYVLLSFLNVIIILILSKLFFKLPIEGSLILLLFESILYITLSLSLGILISTIAENMQQAMFISLIGLLLPSILLSGFIFPIENMPIFYNYISVLLPPRWFIVISKSIMMKGGGITDIWKETLIIVAMTIFFILLSSKKFKMRLE